VIGADAMLVVDKLKEIQDVSLSFRDLGMSDKGQGERILHLARSKAGQTVDKFLDRKSFAHQIFCSSVVTLCALDESKSVLNVESFLIRGTHQYSLAL